MLGSQSLADLRRHPFFYCASDHVLGGARWLASHMRGAH